MTPPPLPPLRPRAATEIVDAAVQLVRAHFGHLLQVAALGTLPSLALVAVQAVVAPGATAIPADPSQLANGATAFIAASSGVSLVAGFATQGALAWSGLAALQGAPLPAVTESFGVAFRRLPALLGAMLLIAIAFLFASVPIALGVGLAGAPIAAAAGGLGVGATAALGLALLLGVGALGIGVYGLLALATTIVVLEQTGPVAAIGRALRLARGSVWRLLVVWLIGMVLFVALFATVVALAAALGNEDVASALGTVLTIPTLPVFGMLALVQYVDVRTRREGADLEAALDALGTPAPARVVDPSR